MSVVKNSKVDTEKVLYDYLFQNLETGLLNTGQNIKIT